ncbi:ABC transporter ATP-binding protein [Streptomyces rapamycinicus]|nr:ABC transporter ATP-binding protein [Streptomyces rapamycinicus]AGP53433.1 hypothetical protein M271_09100 [Streptomyces rapamycinicus NRRL 5491]UTO67849.1 ABC transporter ATP-binding protein/permease [Streptomyces rapamycinicus]UTP37044.1 ABC transporter ATP-binding protein/permease [Streptomyces rapamycinicus NRRL 5491]
MMIRAVGPDPSVTKQKIKAGTAKRILPYTRPYRVSICLLLLMTVANAAIVVAVPILFKYLIDNGIAEQDSDVVVGIAMAVGGLAVLGALLGFGEAWYSARVSEGLVYELRTEVFDHVQRQPLAFFTRAQTGALVSRLNADVVGAQQALTSLLSTVVSAALTLFFVLITMFYLSWVITLISLVVLPFFILPGKVVGRRLQRLMRSQMEQNAEMGALMNERFNVSGALLAKLYGRPGRELRQFTKLAGKVRDLGVLTAVNGKLLFLSMVLLSALATAVVYGVGGRLVIDHAFEIGTLVALATLLTRLFGPINQISSAQANVVTALVSFDRLFEILDLKPLISEKPDALALPRDGAPEIVFDGVSFSYPAAADVSLASLESIAIPRTERARNDWTLRELSFRLPAGKLTALVGPSGAGKTTITHLVPRLYDPGEGTVSIDGHDLRDLTLESLYDTIGVVTQDAYLLHATIGDNLRYARPGATEQEMADACKAAQIWGLIESLPDGFDTVVGDRGYRLSGGEKQRIAMARLLLKAPPVVVLDEATAHLDSESEAALQRALETALAGRTSLVIAHRLSTIRDADQILVIDGGRVRESGTHEELLALGGLYAELYRTQFAGRGEPGGHDAAPNGRGPVPPHGHGPVGNGHAPAGPPRGPYPAGPGAGPFPGPGMGPGPGPAPFPGPGPHPGMRAMPGGPPPGHG